MGKEPDSHENATFVENTLSVTKFLGVFYCLASFGCLGCGVFILWFAQSNLVFPYNTASGIWTGFMTFVIFILGCPITKHFSVAKPEDSKRLVFSSCDRKNASGSPFVLYRIQISSELHLFQQLRQVIWYYTCTIMNVTCSNHHVSYSATGYTYCKNEQRSGMDRCFTDETPRLMLLEGLSMAFGIVTFLLSLFGTIYISTGGRLQKISGKPVIGNNEIQSSCVV